MLGQYTMYNCSITMYTGLSLVFCILWSHFIEHYTPFHIIYPQLPFPSIFSIRERIFDKVVKTRNDNLASSNP